MATHKRRPDYNIIPDAISRYDNKTRLRIYRKIVLLREMEKEMIEAQRKGAVSCQLFLSSGQEAVAAALSEQGKAYQYFPQHRADDLYLSLGGTPESLRDELLARESGCSGGRSGQIGLQIHENGLDMYGDNLLIGECVPRGVGAALGSQKKTVCIFGDGSAEEDYVLASLGFAATRQLPVLFLCMDNNLAILTPTCERRSWDLAEVAKSFGMDAYDLADDPWSIMTLLDSPDFKLPAVLNCRVCREYWHVGIGSDGAREWARNEIIRQQLLDCGLSTEVEQIEMETKRRIRALWEI